jgi:hypothetical protein
MSCYVPLFHSHLSLFILLIAKLYNITDLHISSRVIYPRYCASLNSLVVEKRRLDISTIRASECSVHNFDTQLLLSLLFSVFLLDPSAGLKLKEKSPPWQRPQPLTQPTRPVWMCHWTSWSSTTRICVESDDVKEGEGITGVEEDSLVPPMVVVQWEVHFATGRWNGVACTRRTGPILMVQQQQFHPRQAKPRHHHHLPFVD